MLSGSKIFSLVMPAIIIPFGTVGNVLVILTMCCSSQLRSRSISWFVVGIACADIVCLNTSYLGGWIKDMSNIVPVNLTLLEGSNASLVSRQATWTEVIPSYLFMVASTYSALLVCLVSFERFVSLYLPFKVARFFTTDRVKMMVGLLLVFCAIVYAPLFVLDNIIYYNPVTGANELFGGAMYWIGLLLICVIPLIVVPPFNFLILRKIYEIKAKRRELDARTQFQEKDNPLEMSRREIGLIITLVTVSISHLIFPVPNRILNIINNYNNNFVTNDVLYVVTYHFCKFNFCTNWIYYFFISDGIRSEFRNIWRIFKQRMISSFVTTSQN